MVEPPFFFVHLQKTAGTALCLRLRRQFPGAEMYPNEADGDPSDPAVHMSIERLRRRWNTPRRELRLVTGHFPLCTTERLDGDFTTFTLLREPVERTLSYLKHFRSLTPDARGKTLDEIYDDPERFRSVVQNHMVKMFALESDEMDKGMLTEIDFTPERLARAKLQLETVDAVGLQERFEDFCDELVERFGWNLGDPLRANETEPMTASAELRRRIAEDNALDVELYEFARELTASRQA